MAQPSSAVSGRSSTGYRTSLALYTQLEININPRLPQFSFAKYMIVAGWGKLLFLLGIYQISYVEQEKKLLNSAKEGGGEGGKQFYRRKH